jgi:hypothetical protein
MKYLLVASTATLILSNAPFIKSIYHLASYHSLTEAVEDFKQIPYLLELWSICNGQ